MQQAVVPNVKTKPQLRSHYSTNSLLRCSQFLIGGSNGLVFPSLLFSTTSVSMCKKTSDTMDTNSSHTLDTHGNLSKLDHVRPNHIFLLGREG